MQLHIINVTRIAKVTYKVTNYFTPYSVFGKTQFHLRKRLGMLPHAAFNPGCSESPVVLQALGRKGIDNFFGMCFGAAEETEFSDKLEPGVFAPREEGKCFVAGGAIPAFGS